MEIKRKDRYDIVECNMEKISVIVPIYKAENYLERCIKSIVKQTYQNLEIILVDDGSPDMCPLLCEKWAKADARVVVVHQENRGISAARNMGIQKSSGEYIMMVDSDDYISQNMVEHLYDTIKSTGTKLSVCSFEKGNAEEFSFEQVQNIREKIEIIDSVTALKRAYASADKALQYIAPWGKLYKRNLFDGILYPEGKIFEDIYVTHKLICKCDKVSVIDETLLYYYQHSESIMNKKFHVGKLDYLQALKERINFYNEKGLMELEKIAYDEYLHSLIWEYSRARDILVNRSAMNDIKNRFREVYKKDHSSIRYPKEGKVFLKLFYINPEFIIWYWRICGKFQSIVCRRK